MISTASVAAILGFPGLAAYGAAKAGVVELTRTAAMELASQSIRVNAILPGGIVTPILYDSPLRSEAIDPDALRTMMAMGQPIPRAGEPLDIANAALFLASDESAFITGHALVSTAGSASKPTRAFAGGP